MAIDLLRRTEATPAAYPDDPAGLENATLAWQRVEPYIAWRWSARSCTWIVEGSGDWAPDLTPAAVSTVEEWCDPGGWTAVTLDASWTGGYRLEGAVYRITATVGDASPNDVPDAVQEAVRRLDAYLAETDDRPGSSSYDVNLGGAVQERYDRAPTWIARALQHSGAADLLRPYRRV